MASQLGDTLARFQRLVDAKEAKLAARRATKPGPAQCNPYRQSDEIACRTCGMRWDAHEPKPDCPRAENQV